MNDQNDRLGIDVGGTFTDLVLLSGKTGAAISEKVLTNTADPAKGVLAGVDRLIQQGMALSRVSGVIHGTTLVANALIERKGSRTGLLTTRGFRDILHFAARELRYDMFDPNIVFPEPLVPRALRREILERVDSEGKVITELDAKNTRLEITALLEAGVQSLAVCFLHAYLFPKHELEVRRLIHEQAPGLPVSLSHEVLPQMREYERTSATVINAFVQPLIGGYLKGFEAGLQARGFTGQLYLMTSSGGTVSRLTAERFPIQLVESGPAAGALAAIFAGGRAGHADLLSFDMGGTTAKAAVIKNGRALINKSHEVARVQRFKKGSGLPVGIPVLDLLEVGAGGGSIARINDLGLLEVGPESAGADPGPICYGRGGKQPTVTDADVVLGFLNPAFFLGGEMALDADAAKSAIGQLVGDPMGLDHLSAAAAITNIVVENMAEAARLHSVEMNVDIRRHGIIAFGGAGPIHAYGVARRLGSPFILCPRDAGVLSAFGLLIAPLSVEISQSMAEDLEFLSIGTIRTILRDLEAQGRAVLEHAGVVDFSVERSVDMRYVGQGFEVTTEITLDMLDSGSIEDIKQAFDRTYTSRNGITLADLPARAITWHVRVSGPAPDIQLNTDKTQSADREAVKGYRSMLFPEYGLFERCAVYSREKLAPGDRFEGPAAIEEIASTVILPPGAVGWIDEQLNIFFNLGENAGHENLVAV